MIPTTGPSTHDDSQQRSATPAIRLTGFLPNCCTSIRHLAKGATPTFITKAGHQACMCDRLHPSALPQHYSKLTLPIIADNRLDSSHRFHEEQHHPRCHAGQARCDPRPGARARPRHLMYCLRRQSVMARGMRHGRGVNPHRHRTHLLQSLRPSLCPSPNLSPNL